MTHQHADAPPLLLLGSRGSFTEAVLGTLLERGTRLSGLVLAGRASPVATGTPPSLALSVEHGVERLARRAGLEVVHAARADEALTSLPCQRALLACFPFRLSAAALAVVPGGVFNLHPSPLPAWRGPSPLFWQFRAGATATAVTLHRVDAGLDTGAVIDREPLPVSVDDTFDTVNPRLAVLGAGLACRALAGAVVAPGEPQPTAQASHQGIPGERDFDFRAQWSAERAYRFVRGTAAWGRSWRWRGGDGQEVLVFEAESFDAHAVQSRAVTGGRGRWWLRMCPGLLRVRGERVVGVDGAGGSPTRRRSLRG